MRESARRLLSGYVNRFMVPMLRSRWARFMGNPVTGYFLLLTTKGRKSGLPRTTPLNVAVMDGNIYFISGFGRQAHWFLNVQANPDVEVQLPERRVRGIAQEVTEPAERVAALRRVLKSAGFAGFVYGNPYKMSEADLARHTNDLPVLRIRETDTDDA